jgi:hypothetical protein
MNLIEPLIDEVCQRRDIPAARGDDLEALAQLMSRVQYLRQL